MVFALFASRTVSAQAGGYDPNAMAFFKKVVEAHDFRPFIYYGARFGNRFGPTKPPSSRNEEIKAKAAELFRKLKRLELKFINPFQRADRIEDLDAYLSLKRACAFHPRGFWNIAVGRRVPNEVLTHPTPNIGLSAVVTPYVPGSPRPVDYEAAYIAGGLIPAPATENFALYRLPTTTENGDEQTTYVFRAEEYNIPLKDGKKREQFGIPGSLIAFEHPSCVFRGSDDFYNFCTSIKQRELVRGNYLAEVIELDGQFFALILNGMRCFENDETTRFVLVLWDLGINSDTGGNWYALTTKHP